MRIDILSLTKTYGRKIAHVIEAHVVPHLKDDKDLTRLLKLAYRFIPYPARLVVSKERFVQFILAQKHRFVPADSAAPMSQEPQTT